MTTEKVSDIIKDITASSYPNVVYSIKTRMPYPVDVVKRMQAKYPNFPDMSEAEYKNLIRETEISTEEFMLIKAMQTSRALEMVKDKLTEIDWLILKATYSWLKIWEKDGFKGYYEAKLHLEKVDRYHLQKYGQHYDLWYIDKNNQVGLLNWSKKLENRILKKYGKGERPKKKSIISDY